METADADIETCKALGLAVLQQAIADLETARKKGDEKLEAITWQWFASDDDTWVFSFAPLCEWLGLDPQATRKQLRYKWRHKR